MLTAYTQTTHPLNVDNFYFIYDYFSNPPGALIQETRDNKHLLLLYFIPSFLYCIYNNLTFKNLATFDPTTYYLLLQFRVVITGVLFQVSYNNLKYMTFNLDSFMNSVSVFPFGILGDFSQSIDTTPMVFIDFTNTWLYGEAAQFRSFIQHK